ncbi:MAG: alpha/beta hydrolase [Ktedonobacterales bacterium]
MADETDSPTLVFIHGSGDGAYVWEPLTQALQARRPALKLLAVDLPGHGGRIGDPGPEQVSVRDYAEDAYAELKRQGIASAYLVGHSLGGAIALTLALDHADAVRGLIIVGSGARLRVLPTILAATLERPDEAAVEVVVMGYAAGHEADARQYATNRPPNAPGMLHRDLAACDVFDMMADIERIHQPTLVIVGQQDHLTPPKFAQYLADHLHNAQLTIIPDAGHYALREQPNTVADAISTWLAEQAGDTVA